MRNVQYSLVLLSENLTIFLTAPTGLPQNIHALEINESSLTLVWDPPLASEQNGLITNYVLNMTTEEGNMLYFETNSNTFTFSNLDPYGVYYFAITAETVAGQGPFSIPMPFLTGEAGMYTESSLWVVLMHILSQQDLQHLLIA